MLLAVHHYPPQVYVATGETIKYYSDPFDRGIHFPSWFVVLFLLLAAGLVVYFATRKE